MSGFWFAVHFFWTVVITVFIQARLEEFAKAGIIPDQEGYYLALILAGGAFFSIFVQLTVGFLSDHTVGKYGRRKPYIVVGSLLATGFIAALFTAPGFWTLFLSYLGVQLSVNFAAVPYQGYIPDLVPRDQHARASAYLGVAHLTGKFLGLLTIAALFFIDAAMGYFPAVFGGVFLTAAWICVTGVAERAVDEPATELQTESVTVFPGVRLTFPLKPGESFWDSVKRHFLDFRLPSGTDFYWVWGSRLVVHMGYYAFVEFAYYYVRSGLDNPAALADVLGGMESPHRVLHPVLLAVIVVAGYLGNWFAGEYGDDYHKRTLIWYSLGLSGLCLIGFILTSNYWFAIAMGLGMGAGWGSFLTLDWAFATTLMTPDRSGRFMGLWDVSTLMPQILAVLISGLLLEGLTEYFTGAGMAEAAAEGTAVRWIFATIFLWFAVGSLMLIKVKSGGPVDESEPGAAG